MWLPGVTRPTPRDNKCTFTSYSNYANPMIRQSSNPATTGGSPLLWTAGGIPRGYAAVSVPLSRHCWLLEITHDIVVRAARGDSLGLLLRQAAPSCRVDMSDSWPHWVVVLKVFSTRWLPCPINMPRCRSLLRCLAR